MFSEKSCSEAGAWLEKSKSLEEKEVTKDWNRGEQGFRRHFMEERKYKLGFEG